jgi:hypothetical protein
MKFSSDKMEAFAGMAGSGVPGGAYAAVSD